MNAYRVHVSATVSDTIAVRAKDPKDAERVAALCFQQRLTYDRVSDGGNEPLVHADTHGFARPGDRVDTYTCSGCGESSPKITFGPGWNTCPRCGAPPEPANSTVE